MPVVKLVMLQKFLCSLKTSSIYILYHDSLCNVYGMVVLNFRIDIHSTTFIP